MARWIWALSLILLGVVGIASAEDLFDTQAARERFNAGLNLYFKKNYEGAIKEFDAATRIDPGNPNAYYFIGYSYYQLKDMKKAAELFRQAYEVDAEYSPLSAAGSEGDPRGQGE